MRLADLDLTRKVTAAASSSLTRLHEQFPHDDFFAYAIVTYPFFDSVSFCANSLQNHAATIARMNTAGQLPHEDADAFAYFKWSPEEWGPFEAYDNGSTEWRAAEHQIRSELPDPFGATIELAGGADLHPVAPAADGSPTNEQYLFSCMCEALRVVEERGELRVKRRDEALTFICVMGDPNSIRWESALLLNEGKASSKTLSEFRNSCG